MSPCIFSFICHVARLGQISPFNRDLYNVAFHAVSLIAAESCNMDDLQNLERIEQRCNAMRQLEELEQEHGSDLRGTYFNKFLLLVQRSECDVHTRVCVRVRVCVYV